MSRPVFSYTEKLHQKSYDAINPELPGLSTKGKVVLITGATGGIGSATASSFAVSGAKALVLLGRKRNELEELATRISSRHGKLVVKIYTVDLCKAEDVREIFDGVTAELGHIDILVNAAGVLAPMGPLLHADPANFLDGYKTTIISTLTVAQAVVLANKKADELKEPKKIAGTQDDKEREKDVIFINLTTAGILYPPLPGMGAYVSSKLAAVKLLQCFAAENGNVRLHNVHPGLYHTEMAKQMEDGFKKMDENLKLGIPYDDISLAPNFLVWIASPEAGFLDGKLVFANWDVEELKKLEDESKKNPSRAGELEFSLKGFPRYINGNPLF